MSHEDLKISSLYSVHSKVAVVTGGGSGIGAMIASAFVQNGATVYIASRKEKALKEVSESLNKIRPGCCHYIVADLSSKAGCDTLVDAIKAKESKIHILVNNSGASWGAPFDNFPEREGWDRILSLNVKAVFYLTAGLTPLLAKDSTNTHPGSVINISSVGSLIAVAEGSELAKPGDGLWSYATSKAALNHLTAQLAVTLAPKNICVNAILPGLFESRMTSYGLSNLSSSYISKRYPMGRYGSIQDIAGLALFLSSPASSHITGVCIRLDGGATISISTLRSTSSRL